MKGNGEAIALTVLTVAEVPNLYSGLLPSMFTISHFGHQPETVKWIRKGEVIASILSLTIGGAVSHLTNSPIPMIGTVAMMVILLMAYEHALNNPSTEEEME